MLSYALIFYRDHNYSIFNKGRPMKRILLIFLTTFSMAIQGEYVFRESARKQKGDAIRKSLESLNEEVAQLNKIDFTKDTQNFYKKIQHVKDAVNRLDKAQQGPTRPL